MEAITHPVSFAKHGLDVRVELCAGMWAITLYPRCDHRCVYCCTGVQGDSVPMPELTRPGAIEAALEPLGVDDLLLIGAMSDAYPPVEAEVGLTRRTLEVALGQGRRITIVTKGDTVLRDIDLLLAFGDRGNVQVSICSTDDEVLAAMEPGAPSGTRRFEVIAELHAAGVPVELNALPWIPGITDAGALLARLPDGVSATFAPLSTGGERRRVLDTVHHRQEVWDAYMEEYLRYGHLAHTSWVRPSPPPNENHPLARLPVLDTPADLTPVVADR
jgi:DNA repair photolyase